MEVLTRPAPLKTPGLLLRAPTPVQLRECRRLLPELPMGEAQPRIRVLVHPRTDALQAVVASAPCSTGRAPSGHRFWLHVLPACRGQGLGTALIRRLAHELKGQGVAALLAWLDGQEEPGSRAFLSAVGFETHGHDISFEAPVSELVARVRGLHDWLQARGSLPASARFVSLPQAPIDDMARLYADHIGGSAPAVRRQLGWLAQGPQAHAHPVLMVDGQLAGFAIVGLHDDALNVIAKVVAPAWRAGATGLGWVDVMLMMQGGRWALAQGDRPCRFSCLSGNTSTRKLARRVGARATASAEVCRLLL